MTNRVEYSNRSNDPIRVFLDSRTAEQSQPNHYRFQLNVDAYLDTHDIYLQIRKTQCSYSWYNISSSNNSLTLGGVTNTLPVGNYSANDLVNSLNSLLWGSYDITFAFDPITAKVSIVENTGVPILWGIETTTLHTVLGFPSIPTDSASLFISPGIVDVSAIKALNFHLYSVPGRSFSVYEGNTEITRLMSTLFVGNAIPYSVISSTDETIFKESSLQNEIRYLEFYLLDQNGNTVDLQGGSFQMLIEFTFRPKKVFSNMITI